MGDVVRALMQSPLGKEMTSAEANVLAEVGEVRVVHEQTTVFEAGAPGDLLYVILEGEVQVMIGKPFAGATVIATLGPGQIVGELEVMTHSLRVAALAATQESKLLEISAKKLDELLAANNTAANKLVLTIARTLARRLAAVNQRIVRAKPAAPALRQGSGQAPAPAVEDDNEPVEISDDDVMPIDDDDLDVLDKLWG